MKVKNILLAVTLVSFAIGFSDLHESMIFWLGRPVGAIFAIAYFICVLLEKPFAEMDAENALNKKVSPGKKNSARVATGTPALSPNFSR